jgi:uncharacterized membrane protein YgcG
MYSAFLSCANFCFCLSLAILQIDLTRYGSYDNSQVFAAEDFARHVHDTWGVGEVCNQGRCNGGSTGVLFFLSDADRAMFISRGHALNTLLTDSRLDAVIQHMTRYLKRGEYAQALVEGIREVEKWIEKGEPDWNERGWDWFWKYSPLMWVGLIVGIAYWAVHAEKRRRRDYAKVASQLSELDRAKAEALQGQFHATSCPICLEDFKKGEGDKITEGSDGKPVKLLRCGHVFDETCWNDWVNSGRGTVDKCPICQQDVGPNSKLKFPGTLTLPRPDQQQQQQQQPRVDQPPQSPSNSFFGGLGGTMKVQPSSSTSSMIDSSLSGRGPLSPIMFDRQRLDHEMMQRMSLQRYIDERNFRLLRLQQRYSQFMWLVILVISNNNTVSRVDQVVVLVIQALAVAPVMVEEEVAGRCNVLTCCICYTMLYVCDGCKRRNDMI